MIEDPSSSTETSRRAVLGGLGATISGFGVGDLFGDPAQTGSEDIVLRQGDRCLPVRPISGDQSVESFYKYYLPETYSSEENGGTSTGSGSLYSSLGTMDLQQPNGSILFLYDGPNGLSLVVVHGSTADSSRGGSVSFAFEGLPAGGTWSVKDDLYRDPDTGEIESSNFDQWSSNGTSQVVDWTWAGGRTDGGAFSGLGDDFSVTIDPSFNEAAALYEKHYDGDVLSWELLVPSDNDVTRETLDMTEPVTIETGTCDGSDWPRLPSVDDIEFRECGEAWVVFGDDFEGTAAVSVETTDGWQDVDVSVSDLERIPSESGRRSLFRWRGRGKVLKVKTAAGVVVSNPNNCASRDDDDGDDRDENTDEPDGESDDASEDSDDSDSRESEDDRDDVESERDGGDESEREDDDDDEDDEEGEEDEKENDEDDDDESEDDEERGRGGPPWRDDNDDERPGGGPPWRDDSDD